MWISSAAACFLQKLLNARLRTFVRLLPVFLGFGLTLAGVAHLHAQKKRPQGDVLVEERGTQLEPGKTMQESLAPDEAKSFLFTVKAGQYVEIGITPTRPLLLLATLYSLEGDDLTVDTAFGAVAVPFVSLFGGTYRLTIQRADRYGNYGHFHVSLSNPRKARPEDETRIDAVSAFAAGEALIDEPPEYGDQRLTKYSTAYGYWHSLGDRRQETLCILREGEVYNAQGERDDALSFLDEALQLSRALGFIEAEEKISLSLGGVYDHPARDGKDSEKAAEHFRHALGLSRELRDEQAEANALIGIARTDDSADKREYFRRGYELLMGGGHDLGEISYALGDSGLVQLSMGHQLYGMATLQQALEAARVAKDRRQEAYMLGYLASGYVMQADLSKALDYYSNALILHRANGDSLGIGKTLLQIGAMHISLGEMDKALESSRQAVSIRRKMQNSGLEAEALRQLGSVHLELGNAETALVHFRRALALYRVVSDSWGEADTLQAIGEVHVKQAKLQDARRDYEQALRIYYAEDWPTFQMDLSEATAWRRLGSVEISLGETAEASKSLNRALKLLETAGHSTEDEAAVLYELARADRVANHLPEAIGRIQSALDLTEQLRGTVPGADVRASYVAKVRDRYELLIELLMELHQQHPTEGYDSRGLEWSERARARGLTDLFRESHADIRQGVDPGLLEQERSLQAQLSFKAAYRIQLLSKPHTDQQARGLEEEIGVLTTAYEENQAQIRARSPRYASLTQPQPLTLSEIRGLLDPTTVWLEYSLGADRSFLWVITPDSLHSYALPKRAEIESLARLAYKEMSINNPSGGQQATNALGRMLLAPAVEHLLEGKRLVIVAEGALEYIPFAALRASEQGAPLAAEHEIVNLPSASALLFLRKEMEKRTPSPQQVAVLADPVFSGNDPRVSHKPNAPANAAVSSEKEMALTAEKGRSADIQRSARESGMLFLDRLPASRREAETIVALAGRGANLEALDFNASRKTATSSDLAQYRIIHLASHTFLNSLHPELSGIVLSMVDEQGQPQDGFLQAHEVFNLKLNADMVVLSACQTALGKEVRGEGLIGLTRAFMYAGASRVVASLWRVPDEATAELMHHFYAAILKEGLPPAAALRRAQLALRQDRNWSEPYYWAGFVLQGEWK